MSVVFEQHITKDFAAQARKTDRPVPRRVPAAQSYRSEHLRLIAAAGTINPHLATAPNCRRVKVTRLTFRSAAGGGEMEEICASCWPWMGLQLLALGLVMAFPQIAFWLPRVAG